MHRSGTIDNIEEYTYAHATHQTCDTTDTFFSNPFMTLEKRQEKRKCGLIYICAKFTLHTHTHIPRSHIEPSQQSSSSREYLSVKKEVRRFECPAMRSRHRICILLNSNHPPALRTTGRGANLILGGFTRMFSTSHSHRDPSALRLDMANYFTFRRYYRYQCLMDGQKALCVPPSRQRSAHVPRCRSTSTASNATCKLAPWQCHHKASTTRGGMQASWPHPSLRPCASDLRYNDSGKGLHHTSILLQQAPSRMIYSCNIPMTCLQLYHFNDIAVLVVNVQRM